MSEEFLNAKSSYFEACQRGDIEKIKFFILEEYPRLATSDDIKVEFFVNKGLIIACQNNLDLVRFFLTSKDIPINADINFDYEKPLLSAITAHNLEIVDYLCASPELKRHANPLLSHVQENILVKACMHGSLEIVKYLLTSEKLKNHPSLDNETKYGLTPLWSACAAGNTPVFTYIIKTTHPTELREDCLNYMMSSGKIEAMKALCLDPELKYLLNVEKNANKYCMFCFRYNNLPLLKFLVESCAIKMNSKDKIEGLTPFEYAASECNVEVFQYILYDMKYKPSKKELSSIKSVIGVRDETPIFSLEKRDLFLKLNNNLENVEIKKNNKYKL